MSARFETVEEYLDQAAEDRKAVLKQLRNVIKENLPKGFKEVMAYNMPSYVVPHSKYPAGYHCDPKLPLPFLSFASQKNFIALYHMGMYADPKLLKWFTDNYPLHVKEKPDMGKSCIRFKKPEQVPLKLVGELVSKMTAEEWISLYEKNLKR